MVLKDLPAPMLTLPPGLHPDAAEAVLDADRLDALAATALVDTPPEPEFDRLTELTARVASAPVSLVALVDADRSYFKSARGLPATPPGRTVPLSHSLCQHVVGSGEPLVVDDARSHPLVRENGGVTDMGVGAYLGVPVRDPDGQVLGSLCAIDTEARSWTEDERTSIESLAASVEGEIALRAQLADREAAEALARAEAEALAVVVGVNAQLAGELDPDRLVQAVVDAGVLTTRATMGAFFFRPVGRRPEALLFAASGVPRPVLDAFAVVRETSAAPSVFASPTRSGDIGTDPAWSWVADLVRGHIDVQSALAVPVRDALGDRIGTLLFGHPARDAFDARAERTAGAIADQAAIGLQNARLHRALDESERQHRMVLAGLSDVVFQTDSEGRYTYLNQAWTDRTGWEVADAIGRTFLDFTAGDRDALRAYYADAVERSTPDTPNLDALRIQVACADGSVRHFETRVRTTFDAGGAVVGTAGTFTDVTDTVLYVAEREAREAAEASTAEAERMAQLQAAFLSNMSHEIRTPLTAILGNAEFLAEEAPGDLADLAGSIHRGGQRLMNTLDSVLDLAQIDAGKMEPSPQPTDAGALVVAAARDIAPLVESKGLALVVNVDPALGDVAVDRGLLDRVVTNLLGNAVKFTERGGVTVHVRHAGERLVVEVEDTGIGMDADVQDRLFDPFEQASTGHARTHEGNGLGLALVRRVVELLGGAVSVESAPGEGSRFTVTVPAPLV